MGQHAKWEDPEEFEKKVDEYFETEERPTWSGLAYYLGFESRQSLQDYKSKEGFSYPIKKALLRIEIMYEANLSKMNTSGSIFALKNFGWKDTQQITHEIPKGILNIDPLVDDSAHNSPTENIQSS